MFPGSAYQCLGIRLRVFCVTFSQNCYFEWLKYWLIEHIRWTSVGWSRSGQAVNCAKIYLGLFWKKHFRKITRKLAAKMKSSVTIFRHLFWKIEKFRSLNELNPNGKKKVCCSYRGSSIFHRIWHGHKYQLLYRSIPRDERWHPSFFYPSGACKTAHL